MKRQPIPYSVNQLTWIEARKEQPRRETHAAFCARWDRDDVSLSNFNALCKRKGWMTGRTGQYVPGREPENKGKKMPFNANSAKTQFKKGRLPHNTKQLGHEHLTKDGYVEVNVAETNPHTGFERRYVHKHRYEWEQKHGPIPDDKVLKCLDGDKTNTDPSNWEAIPRGLLPRLNGRFGRGYDDATPEVKPTIMAIAKLEHRASEAKAGK